MLIASKGSWKGPVQGLLWDDHAIAIEKHFASVSKEALYLPFFI